MKAMMIKEEREILFRAYINVCKNKNEYIGLGNPYAKILLIGQEPAQSGLISARRIIFTPSVDLKDELTNTAIQITCIDRYGKEVKRVTSADDGEVEDTEQTPGSDTGNTGSNTGSNSQGGDNTGSNTQGGDNTGGGSTGGDGDRDPDGGTNSDE